MFLLGLWHYMDGIRPTHLTTLVSKSPFQGVEILKLRTFSRDIQSSSSTRPKRALGPGWPGSNFSLRSAGRRWAFITAAQFHMIPHTNRGRSINGQRRIPHPFRLKHHHRASGYCRWFCISLGAGHPTWHHRSSPPNGGGSRCNPPLALPDQQAG
ncbi:hypothetical protein VTK56DRAFT_2593 [Thermocarpiscus australiensis]